MIDEFIGTLLAIGVAGAIWDRGRKAELDALEEMKDDLEAMRKLTRELEQEIEKLENSSRTGQDVEPTQSKSE